MKPLLNIGFIACFLALAGCAGNPEQSPATSGAQASIDAAAKALAEAERLRSVWVVWDPGMPASAEAPTLNEILEAARQKQAAGDDAEATRLADQVSLFARLGVEQAKHNQ